MKVSDVLYGPGSFTYKDIPVNHWSEVYSVIETLVRQHINNGDEIDYFTQIIIDWYTDDGKFGMIFVTF